MKHLFLPAWGSTLPARWSGMLGVRWFAEPPFNSPHALISYVHWTQPFVFPKDSYIFGDSGGFTLIRQALAIDSISVLKWQMSQCTAGAILDLPPRLDRRFEWDRCLATTIEFVKRALPVYLKAKKDGHPFRWWGAVHGYTHAEMCEWYSAIAALYPFDDEGEGWAAYPGPKARPMDVARTMRTFQSVGIRRAHFFACTGQPAIATILSLGPECGLEFATFDSAKFVHLAVKRWVCKPDRPFSYTPYHEAGDETDLMEWLRECPCPACDHMRAEERTNGGARRELAAMRWGRWWELWHGLHNMTVVRVAIAACAEQAKKDPDYLLRTVLGDEYAQTMRAFRAEYAAPIAAGRTGSSLLDYL